MDYSKFSREDLIKEIEKLKTKLQTHIIQEHAKSESNGNLEDKAHLTEFLLSTYTNILENIPAPAYLLNLSGKLISGNSPLLANYSFSIDNGDDQITEKILPKEITAISLFNDLDENGNYDYTKREIINVVKNNEVKTLILNESLIFDFANDPIGIVGVIYDITEKRIANEELRSSEQKIRELNNIKDQFFSIVSHDLKSPFSALLGFSQMLLEDFENLDDTDKHTFIEQIFSTATFAFKLLNNLQLWSKITLEKMPVNREVLEFKSIVDEILPKYESEINKNKIILTNDVSVDKFVLADKQMIEIAVENIISNAVKFGGYEAKISLTTKEIDGKIYFIVDDDGIGLSEEDKEKLFRIDIHNVKIGDKKVKGTGLGLILTHLIAEVNSGMIIFESTFGEGTKVQLVFDEFKKANRLTQN